MKSEPIVIVAGEPNSIFFEVFLKSYKNNKFNSPIILICSKKLFLKQAKKLKQKTEHRKKLYFSAVASTGLILFGLITIGIIFSFSLMI